MTNVGKKIKTLVAIVTVIGVVGCVILFFVGNAAYNEDKGYIEYATVNGGAYGYPTLQAAGDNAYNGLQLRNLALILAPCLLISALPLYGFGVIVEGSEYQNELLSHLVEEQKKTNELLQNSNERSSSVPVIKNPEEEKNVNAYLPEL